MRPEAVYHIRGSLNSLDGFGPRDLFFDNASIHHDSDADPRTLVEGTAHGQCRTLVVRMRDGTALVSTESYQAAAGRHLPEEVEEVSLLDLLNLALRRRRWIITWALTVGALAVLLLVFRKPTYTSSASFILQTADQGRSTLAGLAGQLGVQLPGAASTAQSPQFYSDLVQTRSILGPIVTDSFSLAQGMRPESFLKLFPVPGTTPGARYEAGVLLLSRSVVHVRVSKSTGMLTLEVTTPWPTVSEQIATRVLDRVNEFSLRMRQSQAAADLRFNEEQLAESRDSLLVAEDRLAEFQEANRQFNSPVLAFTRERLQRAITLDQQVYMSIVQATEDARLRELRDTPVITIIESPIVPASPDPRGRLRRAFLGVILGSLLGFITAWLGALTGPARRQRSSKLTEFWQLLGDLRRDLSRWLPFRRRAAV